MLKLLKSALKSIFSLPSQIQLINDLDEMMKIQSELMDDNKELATRNSELMAENSQLRQENHQLLEEKLRLSLKQPTDINQEFDEDDLALIEDLLEKCQQLTQE